MKKSLVIFFGFLCGIFFLAAETLTIHFEQPPESGSIELWLFNTPETFGDLRDPAYRLRVPADGRKDIPLVDILPGEYALVVHHDKNGNGELDKNFIGIPREPLGFSNGYRPKGPPGYRRAVFDLATDSEESLTVELNRPLGERGRIGAGVGIIVNSSPYKGADSVDVLLIPALTYNGSRLQIFGPQLRFLLAGNDTVRLALAANYRPGAYEDDDSPVLRGLGDRDWTLLTGSELRVELPEGITWTLGYRHDALGRIGGGEAQTALHRLFQLGDVRLTPDVGLHWTSKQLANHDYGALGYRPGSTLTIGAGLSAMVELNENWWLNGRIGIERLSYDITDSPIVDEDYLISSFFAVSYIF